MRAGLTTCVKWEQENKQFMFKSFEGSELKYFPHTQSLKLVIANARPAIPENRKLDIEAEEAREAVLKNVKFGMYVIKSSYGINALSLKELDEHYPDDGKSEEERLEADAKLKKDLAELEERRALDVETQRIEDEKDEDRVQGNGEVKEEDSGDKEESQGRDSE